MSYANGTQYYNLPQTVGTDKRDWFDTNSAFAAVDGALHAAATGQAADAEAISTINASLAADEADIAALQTASSTQASQISTLQTTVNAQAAQIADVRQDAEDMITAKNEGAAATSTRAYDIGDYFIYNDVLYKATAAIAVGDTIVPNTNCEATNVDTEITAVNTALTGGEKSGHTYFNLMYSANVVSLISTGSAPTLTTGAWTDIGTVDPDMKPAHLIRANCTIGSNYENGRIRVTADTGIVSIYNPTASDVSSCDFCLTYVK